MVQSLMRSEICSMTDDAREDNEEGSSAVAVEVVAACRGTVGLAVLIHVRRERQFSLLIRDWVPNDEEHRRHLYIVEDTIVLGTPSDRVHEITNKGSEFHLLWAGSTTHKSQFYFRLMQSTWAWHDKY
jgi:hypothetical protein